MPKWLLVCFAALLSTLSVGMSATPSAAANANKCVQWNSPEAGYARNLCNKRIEVRWTNGDGCTRKSACDRTILANDVASGMKLGRGTFMACFYPETDVSTSSNGNYYCKPKKVNPPTKSAVRDKINFGGSCDTYSNACITPCGKSDGTRVYNLCKDFCSKAVAACQKQMKFGSLKVEDWAPAEKAQRRYEAEVDLINRQNAAASRAPAPRQQTRQRPAAQPSTNINPLCVATPGQSNCPDDHTPEGKRACIAKGIPLYCGRRG